MKKMNRQEFFQEAFKSVIDKILNSKIGKALESFATEENSIQRPPGASSTEKKFLELCKGCDACMVACPVNIILIDDLCRRDPIIYAEKNPCIRCPGYPCIAACPTGALNLNNGTNPRAK